MIIKNKNVRVAARQPSARAQRTFALKPTTRAPGSSLLSECAWVEEAGSLSLTKCETKIVAATFDNQTERAIAAAMELSPHTIHTHMNRVFKKLNVTTRTELALRVIGELLRLTVSPNSHLPPICPNHHNSKCQWLGDTK